MTTMPDQYYSRFDPAKNFDEHLFIAGRGLQSAELNEIQKSASYRLKTVADALLKDGDVIRDATVVVDASTGITRCASGAVYLRGAVRGVPTATITIPVTGVVAIGIRMIETVVTAVEDVTLLDPATGTRNYAEPGADRLRVDCVWGWSGDGGDGEFFPIYTSTDGVLDGKEPPPALDAITQSIARYDRDSAGGTYVVSGMTAQQLPDDGNNQVYSVSEGRARVYGYGIEFPTSRRVTHAAVPNLLPIANEPHLSATAAAQRINFDRTPGTAPSEVSITAEKTVTVVHGIFSGAQDPLPDTSVLQLIEVKQGATTYTPTTDYLLTAGKVDWSPAGAEPAPGSSYTVKYRYITDVTPTAVDDNGFTVTGAVAGTLVLVTYQQKLPRIDRLCLDTSGRLVWQLGVASEWSPQPPSVPADMLSLASVYQTWTSSRTVVNDSVRVVPMQDLAQINGRIDYVLGLVAQQRLEGSANLREASQKKGLATDPFLDDSLRDAGTAQTAAVFDGEMTLAVNVSKVASMSADITAPAYLSYSLAERLSQLAFTSTMKVNPYMAFTPIPGVATLTPAFDRWTQYNTTWASPITRRFAGKWLRSIGHFEWANMTSSTTTVEVLSSSSRPAEFLRQISVSFRVTGFGPNEVLSKLTFDGITVTPTPP